MTDEHARIYAAMMPGREMVTNDLWNRLGKKIPKAKISGGLRALADQGHITRTTYHKITTIYRRPE